MQTGNKLLLKMIQLSCKLLFTSSVVLTLFLVIPTSQAEHHQNYATITMAEPGKKVSFHNHIAYYMYNVTNPREVEEGGFPSFAETGPYIYEEEMEYFNATEVTGKDAVHYKVRKTWKFMREMSAGDETDLISVINIPMLILASKLSSRNLPKAFNDILVDEIREHGDSMVRTNQKIGDVLYHGMNVTIYTEILEDILQGNVPPEFRKNKFALFKNQNETVRSEYTVSTRKDTYGDVIEFNNKEKLPYWSGECNNILGTDGYRFRDVTRDSKLKIFYEGLCRSVYLEYQMDGEIEGLPVYKFTFPEDLLEDPTVDERNLCYCAKPLRVKYNETERDPYETCLGKGFVDFGSCKQGSPLLVSYPHFLNADEKYLNLTKGLNPVYEKHRTEFLIEPETGILLGSTRRYQFNVKIQPLDNVGYFQNQTFMIFPVFWQQRTYKAAPEVFELVKEELAHRRERGMAEIDASSKSTLEDDSENEVDVGPSQFASNSTPNLVGSFNILYTCVTLTYYLLIFSR